MSAATQLRNWAELRVGALPAFPFVVAAVFAVAMTLPSLNVPGVRVYSGLDLLFEGWQGVRAGVFAWFANPLFLVGLLLAIGDFRRGAGIASGFGCVLALTSFASGPIARSNGVAVPEIGFLMGFYVWLGAQLALLGWSWLGVRSRQP